MASSTPKRAIKFSDLEKALIALLPNDGSRVDTGVLTERYYAEGERPMNARTIVIDRLKRIAAKAECANLTWRLRKTERSGPHPQSFWIEKT